MIDSADHKSFGYEFPLFRLDHLVTVNGVSHLEPSTGLPDPQLFTLEWWTADMIRSSYRSWLEGRLALVERPHTTARGTASASEATFVDDEVAKFMAGFGADGLVVSWAGNKCVVALKSDFRRFTGIAYVGPKATEAFNFDPPEPAKDATGLGGTAGTGKAGQSGAAGQRRKGSYINTGDSGTEGEFAFPRPRSAASAALVCESFGGEPPLEKLPPDVAAELRTLIDDIASRLALEPCGFAGNFCVGAAWVLGHRARTTSEHAAESAPGMLEPPKHKPIPGVLDFRPTESPAVQFLRHLADIVPRLTRLARRIDAAYQANSGLITGFRANHHIGWMLDFGYAFTDALVNSVKEHFIHSTRTVFLQLLHTSKLNIEARQSPQNFENYARFFEQIVRSDLLQEEELQRLKSRFGEKTDKLTTRAAGAVLEAWRDPGRGWREARNGIFDVLENRSPFLADVTDAVQGAVILGPDNKYRIKDSQGHLWTMDQLERAIAVRRDTATQIDPLMQQLMSDVKLKRRFTSQPYRVREQLEQLLEEMADANKTVRDRVAGDEHYAFGMAPIDDEYSTEKPQTVGGTGYVLQGVHLLAHQTMQEFFRGDIYYTMGVRQAMRIEDTSRFLKEVAAFTIPLVLAVVCAPLGVIAGIAFAAEARLAAGEKMEAYRALINPEAVFDYAQLEAELFAADLGLAISFIPVPGMARTVGVTGARVGVSLLKGEVRAAAGLVTRSVYRVLTKATLKALREGLVEAFIKQLVIGELMSRGLNLMISPVIEQMQREHLTYEQLVALAAEVHEG